MVLLDGDRVTTTCTWFNDTDREVVHGVSTHMETCHLLAYAWPARALDQPVPGESLLGPANTCL